MFLPQGLFFIQTAVWRLQTPKQANSVRFLFQRDFSAVLWWKWRQRDHLRVYFRIRQELTEALIIITELVDFELPCGVLRTSFKAGGSSFFPLGSLPISFLPLPESRGPLGLSRIVQILYFVNSGPNYYWIFLQIKLQMPVEYKNIMPFINLVNKYLLSGSMYQIVNQASNE